MVEKYVRDVEAGLGCVEGDEEISITGGTAIAVQEQWLHASVADHFDHATPPVRLQDASVNVRSEHRTR